MLETVMKYFTQTGLPALTLLAVGVLAIRLIRRMVRSALRKSRLEKAAHSLILSVVNVTLYILLALMVAARMGVDVSSIVTLASVLTLSVSLALQDMLANVFGGFTLLTTHPFRTGDYVEIAGQGGMVREINMAYTKLATPDNKLISIPNSAVVAAQIVNYSIEDTRRLAVDLTCGYEEPFQKVLDALVVAGTMDNVLMDPAPMAVILGYGERGVNYSLRVWVKNSQYWDVSFELHQRIKKIFDEQGISMAYNQTTLHISR